MKRIFLALVVGVGAGCGGTESDRPQYWDMWNHRVANLSDAQIESILGEAQERHLESLRKVRVANEKLDAIERQLEAERKAAYEKAIAGLLASRPAECDNQVYRVRNLRECQRYDIYSPENDLASPKRLEPITPESWVKKVVMGDCMKTETVRDARRMGCLPKEGGVSPRPKPGRS